MPFSPTNPIVILCARGMECEGLGQPEEAAKLFMQAWNEASDDFEKFTAAHYVARHQNSVVDKLKWDETALEFALNVDDEAVRVTLPSLYLNIAKCHEDLGDRSKAEQFYLEALSHVNALPDDGYGKMIRGGVMGGLNRIQNGNA